MAMTAMKPKMMPRASMETLLFVRRNKAPGPPVQAQPARPILAAHEQLAHPHRTCQHGWWLPGGGIDRGETAEQAVIREMREETGLIVEGRPRLVSVHSNERFFPGDHVLVYRMDSFSLTDHAPDGEIAEIGWFAPAALPEDTHRATRARLAEAFGDETTDPDW